MQYIFAASTFIYSREERAPEYDVASLSPLALERLRYGVWLGRQTGAPLMFSGGLGHAAQPGISEAEVAAEIPARVFGRITNDSGLTIGSYELPSTLTGGTCNRTWQQPITFPQPSDTLIGSYGGAGDNPPTAAGTSEFFVLYNCTTKQLLYSCTGSYGSCPTTALQGIAKIAEWVESQYAARRTSSISYQEMIEQARKYLPEYFT